MEPRSLHCQEEGAGNRKGTDMVKVPWGWSWGVGLVPAVRSHGTEGLCGLTLAEQCFCPNLCYVFKMLRSSSVYLRCAKPELT